MALRDLDMEVEGLKEEKEKLLHHLEKERSKVLVFPHFSHSLTL